MDPSLNPDKHPEYSGGVPPLIESPSTIICPDADLQMALCCAKSIAHLERFAVPPPSIFSVIDSILPCREAAGMSLLGCAAAYTLMHHLYEHQFGREACVGSLERLAGTLRIWIGGPDGDKTGLPDEVRQAMISVCLVVTKSVVGMDASRSRIWEHERLRRHRGRLLSYPRARIGGGETFLILIFSLVFCLI